jgi:hypothetical protein
MCVCDGGGVGMGIYATHKILDWREENPEKNSEFILERILDQSDLLYR